MRFPQCKRFSNENFPLACGKIVINTLTKVQVYPDFGCFVWFDWQLECRKMANRMGFEIRGLAIAALVPLALGACGSSSSTDRTVPPVEPPPTRASFDQVANQARSLFDEQVDIDYTPAANVPVSGTATYSGAAAYKTESNIPPDLNYPDYENAILTNPEFVSEMKLTANFGS